LVDADLRFVSRDWKPDKGESIPFGKLFAGSDPVAIDLILMRSGEWLDLG
jgi:hypothetical protein